MIYTDIVLGLVLAYGLIQGLRHGIVKELAFFVAIAVGILVSRILSPQLAVEIHKFTEWDNSICLIVAYSTLFLAVAITLHLIAKVITKALRMIALGWLNRLMGGVFGVLKMGLIASVILNLLIVMNVHGAIAKDSYLFAPTAEVLNKVLAFAETVEEIEMPEIAVPDIKIPDVDLSDIVGGD